MSTSENRLATLDAASLRELIDSGRAPRLLDVRTPAEFETSHIPGAYNVPLDLLREHRAELRHHLDEDVVLICRSGARATQAEQALAGVGLPNLQGPRRRHAWPGRPPTPRSSRAHPAGTWNARSVWSPARSSWSASSASVFVPGLKWVAGFIGAGLTFAAVTNTCAMGMLLGKLPYNRGASCDLDTIVGQLREGPTAGSRS